ncbi:AAA family ATPase, partial [Runella sp.]|uniref:AAA family ATPase n=1 Tax=Runella sp. TaxID=1960881 RepID=UPI0030181DA4
MDFPKAAGWHVLIGDNGSGKSTVVRAIAMALIGKDLGAVPLQPSYWLKKNTFLGTTVINIFQDSKFDGLNDSNSILDINNLEKPTKAPAIDFKNLQSRITFLKGNLNVLDPNDSAIQKMELLDSHLIMLNVGDGQNTYIDWGVNGWFSAGFGPFRRFTGGNIENEKLFKSHPRIGAHLSLFREDIALSEALDWLKDLDYQRLMEKESNDEEARSTFIYRNVIKFINESEVLPYNTKIKGIDKNGVNFVDGNGMTISDFDLSDGFRSILSIAFELIRQLVNVYGASATFETYESGDVRIHLPGVVLIDEIDAHLHPSWQTEIGQWFTKYFPKLQFIVTTHSPLVCRACEHGTIWRLASPGSGEASGEITGTDRERLIYGNILDAYGTEVFGQNTVRSNQSNTKLDRLGRLNMLSALGKITPKEE